MLNFLKGCRKDIYDIPIRDSLTHCIQEQQEEILSCSFFHASFQNSRTEFLFIYKSGQN